MSITALVASSLLEIIISCKSSQNMINVTEKLCQQVEWKMVLSPVTQQDLQDVKVILNMRKKIRFRALNYFGIKSATILTLVSYVGSYAVILIQTR
jgi:hypothetical protein